MSRNRLLSLVSATVLAPVIASAEPAHDTYVDPLSMDRQTPETSFSIDLGYEVWDEPPGYRNLSVFGVTAAGQYLTPGGLGGYVALPLSYIDLDIPLGPLSINDSELALGNIEAGAVYAKPLRGSSTLVFHGGLALPTADDDGPGGLQAYASAPRYGDLVQRWPGSTWLRLGVSPMGRSGTLFWRADLGLDLALDDDNATEISPVVRINVGGGVDLGSAQLLGELVTEVIDNNAGDDSAATVAIGARFASGNLRPGIGLLFPLGFDGIDDYLDFVLIASLVVHVSER